MDDITSFEQLEKRVEWLDNERRNDKTNLASLQNRLTGLESENISLRKQIKELELEISGLKNQMSSLDKYDNRIERLNIDLTKQVRDVNERSEMNLNEAVKRFPAGLLRGRGRGRATPLMLAGAPPDATRFRRKPRSAPSGKPIKWKMPAWRV